MAQQREVLIKIKAVDGTTTTVNAISAAIKNLQREIAKPVGGSTDKTASYKSASYNAAIKDIDKIRNENLRAEKAIAAEITRSDTITANNKVREARRAANGVLSSLKDIEKESASSANNIKGVFAGSFLGSFAAGLVSQFTSQLTSGAKAVFEYTASLQQARVGFETLTGSAQNAETHIKELQEFAKRTPFDFGGLVHASQLLQGVGINAKRIIPILSDVGNVLSAAGKGNAEIQRTVLALSQIASKGKLAGQEINQLAENGISAVSILSQALGKTRAEIIQLSEDGRISTDVFFAALEKVVQANGIGDAMEKQSHTFKGALSNITDALFQFSEGAFRPFFNEVSKIADNMAKEIGKQNADFESIGKAIGTAISATMGVAIAAGLSGIKAEILKEFANLKKDIEEGRGFSGISTPTGFGASAAQDTLKSLGLQAPFEQPGSIFGKILTQVNQQAAVDAKTRKILERIKAGDPTVGKTPEEITSRRNNYFNQLDSRTKGSPLVPKGAIILQQDASVIRYLDSVRNTIETISIAAKKVPSLEEQLLPGKKKGAGRKIKSEAEKITDSYLNSVQLRKIAEDLGLTVTSTTGGKHNADSKHYQNLAVDARTRDKSPSQIEYIRGELEKRGVFAKDERVRPKGQKVWGGPHLHLEDARLHGGRKQKVDDGFERFTANKSDERTKAERNRQTLALVAAANQTQTLPDADVIRDYNAILTETARRTGELQETIEETGERFKVKGFRERPNLEGASEPVERKLIANPFAETAQSVIDVEERRLNIAKELENKSVAYGVSLENAQLDLIAETDLLSKRNILFETANQLTTEQNQQTREIGDAEIALNVLRAQNADKQFAARRIFLGLTTEEVQQTREIGDVEVALGVLRAQNGDDQFKAQRVLLGIKTEQLALERNISDLETTTAVFREQNADAEFVRQRRLLTAKTEQLSIEQEIANLQDRIAIGGKNDGLEIQAAQLRDILDLRRRELDAVISINRSQLELANSQTISNNQIRAQVYDHLAQQKTLNQSVADGIISIYDSAANSIDKLLDKSVGKIPILGNIIKATSRNLLSKVTGSLLDKFLPEDLAAAAKSTGNPVVDKITESNTYLKKIAEGGDGGAANFNIEGAVGEGQSTEGEGGVGGLLGGIQNLFGSIFGGGQRGSSSGGGISQPKTGNPIVDKLTITNEYLKKIASGGGGTANFNIQGAGGGGGQSVSGGGSIGGLLGTVLKSLGLGGSENRSVGGVGTSDTSTRQRIAGGSQVTANLLDTSTRQRIAGAGTGGSTGGGGIQGAIQNFFGGGRDTSTATSTRPRIAQTGGLSQLTKPGGIFGKQGFGNNVGTYGAIGGFAGIAGGLIGGTAGSIISLAGTGLGIGAKIGSLIAPGIGTAIGAAVGAIGGGLAGLFSAIFGKSKRRKKEEKERTQFLQDSFKGLEGYDQLIKDVKYLRIDGASAITQGESLGSTIRAQYITAATALKDKKTKNIALKDVSRIDTIIAQKMEELRKAADMSNAAKLRADRIIPEFATGMFFGRDDQMRDMHKSLDNRRGYINGGRLGVDRHLGLFADGEAILNRQHQQNINRAAGFDVIAEAGIPNYPKGKKSRRYAEGNIFGGGENRATNQVAPIVKVELNNVNTTLDSRIDTTIVQKIAELQKVADKANVSKLRGDRIIPKFATGGRIAETQVTPIVKVELQNINTTPVSRIDTTIVQKMAELRKVADVANVTKLRADRIIPKFAAVGRIAENQVAPIVKVELQNINTTLNNRTDTTLREFQESFKRDSFNTTLDNRVDTTIVQKIVELRKVADVANAAKLRVDRIIPKFATGGYFADYFKPNGLLPGRFDGRDDILAKVSKGEMVLNPNQIQSVIARAGHDVFAGVVPNYPKAKSGQAFATGGRVTGVQAAPIINVELHNVNTTPDSRMVLYSEDGKKQVVNILREARKNREI